MRINKDYLLISVVSAAAIGYSVPAAAQAAPQASEDPYAPVGARLGSFMLYPKVEGGITYNDNIYALANKTGDFISRVAPSVELRGDIGTATTAIRASAERIDYFTFTRESRSLWNVGANVSVEAKRGTFVYGASDFAHAFEDRGDPNALFTNIRPNEFYSSQIGGGFSTSATRFRFGVDTSYRYFDYLNNVQNNGSITNNQGRDRADTRVSGRVGYEFSPGYTVLARVTYDTVNYRLRLDPAGFSRSSDGVQATLGVNFELSNLLEGEIYGGYLTRDYQDARFQRLSSAAFGTALTWSATQLTKVRLDINRTTIETVVPGFRGFLSTSARIGVDHEFLRNVSFTSNFRYASDDYLRDRTAIAPRRLDRNYSAGASLKYTINRNAYTQLTYDWTKRSTSVNFPGIAFNSNRVGILAGLQF